MLALSVRQPWTWLIVRPDLTDPAARRDALQRGELKIIENRTWATRQRGRILIHASAGMTRREYEDVADHVEGGPFRIVLPAFKELDRGGIVGQANIVNCVTASDSDWFFGPFGFVLDNIQPLAFRPFKGALGFFSVTF